MKRAEFLRALAATTITAAGGLPAVGRAQSGADATLQAGIKLSPTSMDPHFRLAGEQNLLRAPHGRQAARGGDGGGGERPQKFRALHDVSLP